MKPLPLPQQIFVAGDKLARKRMIGMEAGTPTELSVASMSSLLILSAILTNVLSEEQQRLVLEALDKS